MWPISASTTTAIQSVSTHIPALLDWLSSWKSSSDWCAGLLFCEPWWMILVPPAFFCASTICVHKTGCPWSRKGREHHVRVLLSYNWERSSITSSTMICYRLGMHDIITCHWIEKLLKSSEIWSKKYMNYFLSLYEPISLIEKPYQCSSWNQPQPLNWKNLTSAS